MDVLEVPVMSEKVTDQTVSNLSKEIECGQWLRGYCQASKYLGLDCKKLPRRSQGGKKTVKRAKKAVKWSKVGESG